ncbi:hypothetical protein DM860_008315 [Cuscuta australis]|uniref:Uncharacterized protein n=1 Tax=Cuscuta australis TaxID=267555 RepID=A0A328D360_9ASTE|nr:hypothetical protein DM860_008315 [Cuscuta australis]
MMAINSCSHYINNVAAVEIHSFKIVFGKGCFTGRLFYWTKGSPNHLSGLSKKLHLNKRVAVIEIIWCIMLTLNYPLHQNLHRFMGVVFKHLLVCGDNVKLLLRQK